MIECANSIVAELDSGDGPQATWLLIDEINRAEIDRAFGPLFTALSGLSGGQYTLDYTSPPVQLALPSRFRIIATLNDYDTRFVNTMSGALRRRFAQVAVDPPVNSEGGLIPEGELAVAWTQAVAILEARFEPIAAGEAADFVVPHLPQVAALFGGLRALDDLKGIPVGTAQIVDTLAYLLVSQTLSTAPPVSDGEESLARFYAHFDKALAARLGSSLESDATRVRMSEAFADKLRQRFPQYASFHNRLASFLSGSG